MLEGIPIYFDNVSLQFRYGKTEFLAYKDSTASLTRHKALPKDFDNSKGLFMPDKWIEYRWKCDGNSSVMCRKPNGWKSSLNPINFLNNIAQHRQRHASYFPILKPLDPDAIALLNSIRRHSYNVPAYKSSPYKRMTPEEFFKIFEERKRYAAMVHQSWKNKFWNASNFVDFGPHSLTMFQKNYMASNAVHSSNVFDYPQIPRNY